ELLNDWPGEVLRLNMLRSHYRQPIDWTLGGVKESWGILERWYGHAHAGVSEPSDDFLNALKHDINTPQSIAELHQSSDDERAAGLALLGFSGDAQQIARTTDVGEAEIQ